MLVGPRLIISSVSVPENPGLNRRGGEVNQQTDPGSTAPSLDSGCETALRILGMFNSQADEASASGPG